jgi:hypothetical protein
VEPTNLLVQFSATYPDIAYYIKLLSILIGTMGCIYGLWLELQVALFGGMQSSQIGTIKIFLIIFLSGCILSLGITMNIVGNTFYNYGDFVLEQYSNSESWKVEQGMSSTVAMKTFVIVTSKVLGLIFCFWGIVGALLSNLPNSEIKIWPCIVRLLVGGAMFNPIAVLDFFGGWGTKFLTV